MPEDIYNLERFVEAQNPIYAGVLSELSAGQKRTHWMWFIFPQISGLGRTEIARYYAIQSIDEVKAYLDHPVLAARLRECTQLVNQVEGASAHDIFGSPDDLKFCSSMTLFEKGAEPKSPFALAIDKYFGGNRDQATLAILRGEDIAAPR